MSIKKTRWLVLSLLIIMLLAGCRCDNSMIPTFIGILDSPADGELVSSLSPIFNWHGNASCDPDEYIFRIEEDNWIGSHVTSQNISPTDLPYTYTGGNLLPGRSYTWRVMAKNGAQDDSPSVSGPSTEMGEFFTGPVCSGETLIAPELEYPRHHRWPEEYDDWINHGHDQKFKWTYTSDCLPLHYDYQFANDQAFTDIVLDGTTTEPYVQYTYASFPNCSTMFWRVRANDGTSVGPWSDALQFHWVTDETCWQNHYISDDAARISVRLYHDRCSQTGDLASMNLLTDSGCELDKGGVILVGDGDRTYPPDVGIADIQVDIGSGPCPSTGLDHRENSYAPFNVLAPGTYCVSITRNQIVAHGGINLTHGVWTDPRTNELVAYKTIELGPGNSDVVVYFGWDQYDHFILMPELPESKNCRVCPDPIGPIVDIFMKGLPATIYARDMYSPWKLSEAAGVPCYLYLENDAINEALGNLEYFDWRAEDLEFFPQPPPCPPSIPAPRQNPVQSPKTCSEYATRVECSAHVADGCIWSVTSANCIGP